MATTLRTARRALARMGERGKTTRIPDDVRAVVLAYAREARGRGESWAHVASRVGLSATALQRWDGQRGKASAFVPVVVQEPVEASDPLPDSGLTLSTLHGEKLEGLGVDDAIHILRALR